MYMVGLRSSILVPGVALILAVGCGKGSTPVSPTALTAELDHTQLASESPAGRLGILSASGEITTLGRGGKEAKETKEGKEEKEAKEEKEEKEDKEDKGAGGAVSSGSVPDRDSGSEEGRNHREFSGLVTSVAGGSLTVRGITVTVGPTTVIRHGHRILTITDLHVGDRVQARGIMNGVTLAATEIKVEDVGRDDDDTDDGDKSDVRGTVSGLTGACPVRAFTVGTTRVTTTSTTVFEDLTCATLVNGASVEVEGTRQADGSIAAAKVEADSDEVKGHVSGLTGACPSLAFTVGATRVSTTSSTIFSGGACAAIVNGVKVEVEGARQADGSIVATVLELDD